VNMMGRQTYLIRRGGAYSARLRVPLDLIEVVGRKELVKALGTSDPAEAKRRVWAVVDGWQRQFDALRNRAEMTDSDKEELVWSHYTGTIDRDEKRRATIPSEIEIDKVMERAVERVQRYNMDMNDPLQAFDAALDLQVMTDRRTGSKSAEAQTRQIKLNDLRQHLTTGEHSLIRHEIDAFLNEHSLTISPADRADLSRQLIRAEIEALQRTLERDEGNYGGEPADQLIAAVSGRQGAANASESIEEVFEVFASENIGGVAPDRINQMRRDIGLFAQIAGDRFSVTQINKKLIREWKALMIKFPVKATEMLVFKGMDLREIVAANEKLKKPVISDRSVNRYLSSLSALCKWLVNNGYLDSNPVSGMSLAKEHNITTLPFTADQLDTLFKSPLFTGCQSADVWSLMSKSGNVFIRDHRYWVPLIMLYSGARPSEIGQLMLADVREEEGRWIMHITTEGDGEKRTKTKGSMRVVPLHPMLIKLGLIDYHAAQIAAGETQLFPKAVRNERGQMMAEFSREFSRYLTRIGIKEGRGVSLYSFRHGVTDALRRAGYLDEQFGLILGHTQGTTTGRYGIMAHGMIEQRAKLIDAIEYPNLNLAHLIKC
jgi:integrase